MVTCLDQHLTGFRNKTGASHSRGCVRKCQADTATSSVRRILVEAKLIVPQYFPATEQEFAARKIYSASLSTLLTRAGIVALPPRESVPPSDPGVVVDVHWEKRVMYGFSVAVAIAAYVLSILRPSLDCPRCGRKLVCGWGGHRTHNRDTRQSTALGDSTTKPPTWRRPTVHASPSGRCLGCTWAEICGTI